MFRNYLVTALRNLARNRLYAAISILGLAAAFAAAILIGQFVRHEFSYDRWIPGYQQVYKLTVNLELPGQPPLPGDVVSPGIAAQLKESFPGAVATARLMQSFPTVRRDLGEEGIVDQTFAFADPQIFDVLPLPVLSGDLKTALQDPDTVVITREVARTYFGKDLPIGEMLDVQTGTEHHPMRVTAVLQDLPPNTSLVTEIFASGRSAWAPFARLDAGAPMTIVTNYAFVRVAPDVSADELQAALDEAGKGYSAAYAAIPGGARFSFGAVPMADIHMTAPGMTGIVVKPTGSRTTTGAIGAVAVLIVLVAGINFVTLMTARAARRAVEVGVRKATGARRRDLVIQFMSEALIQVAAAAVIAAAIAAVLMKPYSAFLQRELTLDFIQDPMLLAGLVGLALLVGVLAGFYPALVLSGFRPAAVLKGGPIQTAGSGLARQVLVVVQFAVLIGLIVTTVTIYRQTQFALKQGLGANRDLIVMVWTPCNNAFPEEVRSLPGVTAAACSSLNALNSPSSKNITDIKAPGGKDLTMSLGPVDFGFFEVFDIKPVAGRLFSREHGADGALAQPGSTAMPTVVINEAAARIFGFADPASAVGQYIQWDPPRPPPPQPPGAAPTGPPPGPREPSMEPSEIIGVVPDMPVTVRAATDPMFYFVFPRASGMLSAKLTGQDMPGTVREIERVWKSTGNIRPIQLVYFTQSRQRLYLDVIIQGVLIAICAILAVVIACLGLFALSAFTTERRTKEIGIRKVNGASTFDVVRLLMWQFTIPVLFAIVIALPIGFLLMTRWLNGFVYHVELSAWLLAAAAIAALAIAWFTVSFQTFMVARAKPIGALRYE